MDPEELHRLTEDLGRTEPGDLPALREVQERLEPLAEWARREGGDESGELAQRAADLVGAVLEGHSEDPAADLRTASELVAELASLVRSALEAWGEDGGDAVPTTPASADAQEAPRAELELDPVVAEFLDAKRHALEEMEANVLAMESGGGEAALSGLRRELHTLKGEAGFLELPDIAAFCHQLENLLEDGPSADAVDTTLAGIDWLRRRMDEVASGAPPSAPPEFDSADAFDESSQIAEEFQAPPQPAPVGRSAEEIELEDLMLPYALTAEVDLIVDFVSESLEHLEEVDVNLLALEKQPGDSEALNSVFRAFHTIKGLSGFLDLNCVQKLAHRAEALLDKARAGTVAMDHANLALSFEVNDCLKKLVKEVGRTVAHGGFAHPDAGFPAVMTKLGAALEGRPASAAQPAAALPRAAEGKRAAPRPAPERDADEGAKSSSEVRETIKVDAARLDALVDTIGELVIAEAMISQAEELQGDIGTRIPGLLNRMDKITRELQEMAMSLRMVPVRSTFRKMTRLARDVANRLGKQVEVRTRGDDTELDKTVVDTIGDPLVHMIRNAIDHGLESSAEDRVAAGKPALGRVELRAFHQGGSVFIEIEDDGRGLDREKILDKARRQGLVEEGAKLTDSEVYNLVFAPGFSTAAAVTDVSGRGVGLDVVMRNIQGLRGAVQIRSTLGQGTVFSIRLPLTLAIIDGMVVRVGRERYIFPTISILRMVRPDETRISSVLDRHKMVQVDGRMVPLFRLDTLLGTPQPALPASEPTESAVIVEHGEQRSAYVVDEILGQQQIVIKPLGPALSGTKGLAGGAIMPDGHVGLILDVAGLAQLGQQGRAGSESSVEEQVQPILD